ncbi:hypothetical protein [Pseudomonas sp. C9-3]|uniref:hypothetical protein n=1 Tax=Pseudomonas sp. C9-3 TaxID=3078264 RepID=UPI0028E1B6C6|nr:hypothetical protein [Pseudomonas sp. C9-3]
MFEEFPKWKYRPGEAVIVESAEEELALDGEWFDAPPQTPAVAPAIPLAAVGAVVPPPAEPEPTPPPTPPAATGEPTRDDLIAQAKALGVKYDARWGASRIAAAIAAHKPA